MCQCMSICVDMYTYVYKHDCFMYIHICVYCVCMYFMTMYSAVSIQLVSNSAI